MCGSYVENDNVNLSSGVEEQRDESTLISVDSSLCIYNRNKL